MEASRLNKLPAELRVQIYELTLYQPGIVTLPRRCRNAKHDVGFMKVFKALYHTCKQIRNEVKPVFVEVNRFEIDRSSIPLAGLLQQWTSHAMNVEIAIIYQTLGGRNMPLWMRRVVDTARDCTKHGVPANITAYFAWNCHVRKPQVWGSDGLALRIHRYDVSVMQRALHQSILEARSEVAAWRHDGTLWHCCIHAYSCIGRAELSINELFKALGEDPELSVQ